MCLASVPSRLSGSREHWVSVPSASRIPDTTDHLLRNAKTGGLQHDFNLTSNQYSVVLLIFFVSYVIFEIPSNLILARVRPSLYLSGLAVAWGGIAACMAATNNWRQLAGVRFALGIIEAGFAPGIAFYLSCWYDSTINTHHLGHR